MHSERFRGLVDAVNGQSGPFVSIFFDDSHDTQDAAAQLDARLRDIRKHLEEQSVDAAAIETIESAVRESHPPVGRSGRGVIATAGPGGSRIVLDEHLAVPPVATHIRVSDLPYIVPVIEHGRSHASYLLVAVDQTGADLSLRGGHPAAGRRHSAEVPATHKPEDTDLGGPQGHVEEAVRKTLREVADRITHLVDAQNIDMVFVTGEVSARSELAAALPERVAARTAQLQGGGRTAGTDEAEVQGEIAEEFTRRRLAAIDDAAQRFAAGHGSGLAVDGLAAVTTALRDGAVETLILGDLGDVTVVADHDTLMVIGPDAATVSALGGSPDRVLPADEALPLLAVATGAALVRTDERLSPADGVGAVLRYPDPNIG